MEIRVHSLLCALFLFISIFSSSDDIETVPVKVFLTLKYVQEVRRWSIERETLQSVDGLWQELRDISPLVGERSFIVTWRGKQNCKYFYVLATGILK